MEFKIGNRPISVKKSDVLDGNHRHIASCHQVSNNREEITPEKAAFYLHYNISDQRPITAKIHEYKLDMEQGAWQDNHPQPIVFDDQGNLIDGQHRLLAVVETGVTVWMWVFRGAPSETQETIDTGKSRTLEHQLKVKGEKNVVALAAVLRGVFNYEANDHSLERKTVKGLSNRQALAILNDRGEYMRDLTAWSRSYHEQIPSMRSVFTKKNNAMLRHALLEAAPQEEVDNFFALLRGEDAPGHSQPVKALRHRLEKLAAQRGRAKGLRTNENPIYAYAIKAWNAYLSGDIVENLRWSSGGKRPEAFPEIRRFGD
jgi:hypothetical protein